MIGDAVVGPRALVEERGGHRRGALLARWVEGGAAGNGEPQGHHRHRVVLDEPGLDPAGAGHPRNRHRSGVRHPRRPDEPRDKEDQCSGKAGHEVRSGRRIPVAELRSTRTARAAAAISAGVTAPTRSGQAATSSRLWPIASAAPMMLAGPDALSWA